MTAEEKAELQKSLDALKNGLETAITEKAKADFAIQIKALEDKLKSIDSITAKNTELEGEITKLKTANDKNQIWIDKKIKEETDLGQNIAHKDASFGTLLGKGLSDNLAKLKKYKEGDARGFVIEITKAVGDMSMSNLTGSYFIEPARVPGIVTAPYEPQHMRDFLPVGNTTSNVIRHVRHNGGEGGPAMTAMAAAKPQMDVDLSIEDAPVRKIAVYFTIPEEMIEDIPYLQSFLTQIGMEELAVEEDQQIIYGDGTGQNLTGLYTAGTAFAAGTSIVAAPNRFDVLRAARKQVRNSKIGGPLVAMVSPDDYFLMTSTKDDNGNYLFLSNYGVNLGQQVGVQIVEHTAIETGDFLVFQPRAAMIFDRSGTSIRFYDQHADNAIKNLITIVIEKRLALPIYRPAAIIKGEFATAITDITS
jgi:HK97 family phage major capsid protein